MVRVPLWISLPATALLLAGIATVGIEPRPPEPVTATELDRLTLRAEASGVASGELVLEGLSARRLRALERMLRSPRGATDWCRLVRFLPEPAAGGGQGLPATAGTYVVRGDELRFEPRYPLVPGLVYRAELRLPGACEGRPRRVLRAGLPAPERRPPTRLVAVHPAADRLPENQLKLYLQFSGPMGRASPWRYLRLFDAEGREQRDVFHTAAELWDPERRRLTVLFDPGRIKRGLANHQALGPPLVRGRRYRLAVSAAWPDAAGRPLLEPAEKRFEVGPPDRSRPDPGTWRLDLPRAGSRDPLVVHLSEPLDHALLTRSLAVFRGGPSRLRVEGAVRAAGGDTRWEITPGRPWRPGSYTLRIDPLLEDLAGNNLERLFDSEVGEHSETPPVHPVRRFELQAPSPLEPEQGEPS